MKKVVLIIFFLFLFYPIKTFALSTISISPDKNNLVIGEEFEISINSENMDIASFQIEIYFDWNKLEYVSGPENSNIQESSILYTWVDENGGNTPKKDGELVKFKLKAKEAGEAVFGINGLFFDKDGNEVSPILNQTSVVISENMKNNAYSNLQETTENTDKSNTYLKTLRLGVEGITPDFNKNTTEYTLVIMGNISNLNIEAIPENSKSKVNIYGDTNLKNGLNKTDIEVVSEDGTQRRIYTVNVTRTVEPEKANANLETLAVEYFTLEPEELINNVNYKVRVSSDTEKINIFAVPESRNATVIVYNKEKLDFGENTITVAVAAENGITVKNYYIKAYRPTHEEAQNEEKEQEENAKRLDEIIEEKQIARVSNEQEPKQNIKAKTAIIPTLVLLGVFMILIGYLIIKKKIKIIGFRK